MSRDHTEIDPLEALELLLEDAEEQGHVTSAIRADGVKVWRLTPEGRRYYEELVAREEDSA